MRVTVLTLTHMMPIGGHMGYERTLRFLRDRFWWPHMAKFTKEFINSCLACKKAKTPLPAGHGFLGEYPLVSEPFESIHVDHVDGLPTNAYGNSHILTVICRATSFIWQWAFCPFELWSWTFSSIWPDPRQLPSRP